METKLIQLFALGGFLEGPLITVPYNTREYFVPIHQSFGTLPITQEDLTKQIETVYVVFKPTLEFKTDGNQLIQIYEMVIP